MVSTHLKNISQIGSFPQIGVKIKNLWNHHPVTLDIQGHLLRFGISTYLKHTPKNTVHLTRYDWMYRASEPRLKKRPPTCNLEQFRWFFHSSPEDVAFPGLHPLDRWPEHVSKDLFFFLPFFRWECLYWTYIPSCILHISKDFYACKITIVCHIFGGVLNGKHNPTSMRDFLDEIPEDSGKKNGWQVGEFFQGSLYHQPKQSGQIIATSHDLTPNGCLVREIPLFQGNPGWWNIIIWLEQCTMFRGNPSKIPIYIFVLFDPPKSGNDSWPLFFYQEFRRIAEFPGPDSESSIF